VVEVEPDEGADQQAEQRSGGGEEDLLLRAHAVVNEGGGVDPHEGDEGAEVEQLGTALVGEEEGSDESAGTDDEYVIARDAGAGVDGGEEAAWKRAAFPHAIEQTGGAELCGDS